ncbi:MAG: hypothetical protein ACRDJH_07015 [Thermomicrobiales bacterium]
MDRNTSRRIVAKPRRFTFPDDREPDLPGGEPGDDPAPPSAPTISRPDLAAQLVPCLESIPVDRDGDGVVDPITPQEIELLKAAIRSAMSDGDADVRLACLEGATRIGVWQTPVSGAGDAAARDRGLAEQNLLPGVVSPLNFGAFISTGLINRFAARAFQDAPKRFNVKGKPDENGRIHLTGLNLRFQAAPAGIITTLAGFHDGGLLGRTNFLVEITDRLSMDGQEIEVETTTNIEIGDDGLRRLFTASLIFTIASPIFFGLAFLSLAGLFGLAIAESAIEERQTLAGAGGTIAALIPPKILLPGTSKLKLFYQDVGNLDGLSITGSGITVRGITFPFPREPSLAIAGPSTAQPSSTVVTLNYTIQPDDLRSPLGIDWTAIEGTVLNPNGRATTLRFDIANRGPGDIVTSRLDVSVTDADNFTETATKEISFRVPTFEAPPGPPPDIDEDLGNPLIPFDPDISLGPIIVDGPILVDDDILIDQDILTGGAAIQDSPIRPLRSPRTSTRSRAK